MGAPLFLLYLALSLHSRIELNWIAPSVVPLFCLMAVYWDARWAEARRALKPLLGIGLGIGLVAAVLALDANLLTKILPRAPPPGLDPLRRVLGWKELAQIAGQERRELETRAGKPVFIIGEHYGFTSEITFYLPEAKSRVGGEPLVFCYASRAAAQPILFLAGLPRTRRAGRHFRAAKWTGPNCAPAGFPRGGTTAATFTSRQTGPRRRAARIARTI